MANKLQILPKRATFIFFVFLLTACGGTRPADLGVTDNKLRDCPNSPNCVSTFMTDEEHGIAPMQYAATVTEAIADIKAVIAEMPRTTVVTENERYLHIEFKTLIFRWVDDVEFLFDEANKTIHFRSASRVGYSDLGVNRKRMEEIRAAYQARVAGRS